MGDDREPAAQVALTHSLGHGLHDAGLGEPFLADRAQDRLLGAKDGVDGPRRDSGFLGDSLDRGGGVTVTGKFETRGARDGSPGFQGLSLTKREGTGLDF